MRSPTIAALAAVAFTTLPPALALPYADGAPYLDSREGAASHNAGNTVGASTTIVEVSTNTATSLIVYQGASATSFSSSSPSDYSKSAISAESPIPYQAIAPSAASTFIIQADTTRSLTSAASTGAASRLGWEDGHRYSRGAALLTVGVSIVLGAGLL